MPLGTMLYSENQFKNLIVFFFKDGTSRFFKTFLIAKFFLFFFSKSSQTTPVSLDFPKHKTTRLLPFLKTHNIQSEVVLLDDANENAWINAIDSTWSGAIPATIFYNHHKRDFYEQSFTQDELNKIVSTF